MTDTSISMAVGCIVTSVSESKDEYLVSFNTGLSIRHRKLPLPETINSIVFLGQEVVRHIKAGYSAVHIPIPAAGVEIDRRCVGFDMYHSLADGKGDYIENLLEKNSTTCGYIKYPTRGDILSYRCVGFDYTASIADGLGGATDRVLEVNSVAHCSYIPPPPSGTELSRKCVGFDLYRVLADGVGGSYDVLLEANNVGTCGYVPPVVYPPAGTEFSRRCIGFNLYHTIADGAGGSNEVLLEANNAGTCGYMPTAQLIPIAALAPEYSSTGNGVTAVVSLSFNRLTGGWATDVMRAITDSANQNTHAEGRYIASGQSPSDFEIKLTRLSIKGYLADVAHTVVVPSRYEEFFGQWINLGAGLNGKDVRVFLDCWPVRDTNSDDSGFLWMDFKFNVTIRKISDNSIAVSKDIRFQASPRVFNEGGS